MTSLLIGFDSAWTPGKRGAIVAAIQHENGSFRNLGSPILADFREAGDAICSWQEEHSPTSTIVLVDQPTIVRNSEGQRPVEHLACSSVSLRRGGMQPANTSRAEMFGRDAPIWAFLSRYGGAADPLSASSHHDAVFETYPVLGMIALGWIREDSRVKGRLLKYNPERTKTFCLADWQHLCEKVSAEFQSRGLVDIARWADEVRDLPKPRKGDQDKLDACLCLLVAVHMAGGSDCLMVGNLETGYIVVPHCPGLQEELEARCHVTARQASDWIRTFRFRSDQ